METAGTLQSKWSPSSSSLVGISSSSFSSIPPRMMDDLPFCLEDLPPEIRDKIDDIIEKNEDLESQLDAIDTLLFANRPQAKSDVNNKFDLGNESGIGSDSDSGHGVIPAQDPLTISPFPSRPHKVPLENTKTFGPPLRTSAPNDDVDDFISRIIVPPPPYLTGSTPSPVKPSPSPRELTLTPPRSTPSTTGLHRGIPSVAVSTAPTTWKSVAFDADLPINLPPPPLEFGESPVKETQDRESPPTSEAVSVVRTAGQNFLVTLDVPRGLLSNGSPAGDSSTSNVTRVHVGKEERGQLPVNVTSLPVLNSVDRRSVEKADSTAGVRPSQLYAWNKTSTEQLSSIRESPPDKSTYQKKSVTLPVNAKPQRPSELSISKEDKQPWFWKKGKDTRESPDLAASSPSRYNPVASGPSVEMRRKKWRPTSDVLPEGVRIGSLDSDGRPVNRSTDNVRSDDAEDVVDEDRKSVASDDDFSSIVVMRRTKNGKPAQASKIDSRTLKAQSMLSLYDPSSDLKGRSKDKKTVVKSKSKLDPFAFFRAKNRKHHPERSSSERCVSLDSSALRESDMEPLRSDYLFPIPPPVLSARSSIGIPSPSLYPSSVDPRNSSSSNSSIIRQIRSPPPPGDISDIYRIDVRDLDVGQNRRPPVTFHTFRSEIEPIRWSEERPRFPVSNRWSHRVFEEMESPSCNVSRSPSVLASTCSLPVNLSQFVGGGGRPSTNSSKHQNVRQHGHGHLVRPPCPSPPKQSHKVQETIARSEERSRQSSPSILVFNGDSSPVIKVSTKKVATTPSPQLTRVMAPTEPQVFNPSTTITAAAESAKAGTRLSIASARFSNAMTESGSGNALRQSSSGVYLQPLPRNQHLTPSYSNPDVMKTVPGNRLSPRQSFAGSGEEPQVPQSRISPCPSVTSLETSVSGSSEHDVDSVSWNGLEELLVLQTTYDSEMPGDRAEDDVSRMLSSLEAQRKWLLSAGSSTSSSNPSKVFRSRKDTLATQSRRLVTEAKLMVSAATRSQQELTSTLTPVVHTVARVFESCRQVLAVLPPDVRRTMLLSQVVDVGRMFLNTLTSANEAAGRRHDDPAMEQLMTRTTALAQALLKLLNTTKSLDNLA